MLPVIDVHGLQFWMLILNQTVKRRNLVSAYTFRLESAVRQRQFGGLAESERWCSIE